MSSTVYEPRNDAGKHDPHQAALYEKEVALLKHAKRIRTRIKWDSITYMTEARGTAKTIQGWRVWINAVQFPDPNWKTVVGIGPGAIKVTRTLLWIML